MPRFAGNVIRCYATTTRRKRMIGGAFRLPAFNSYGRATADKRFAVKRKSLAPRSGFASTCPAQETAPVFTRGAPEGSPGQNWRTGGCSLELLARLMAFP